MKKAIRIVAVAGLVASLCLLSAPSAMAAKDDPGKPEAPEDVQVFEFNVPRPDLSEVSTEDGVVSTASVCTFVQRVDYVHISTTSIKRAAQSHGNWGNVNCNYSLADVTTQVDKKNIFGFHYAVGVQGTGRLGPSTHLGSGGGGRVTARYVCNGTAWNNFRSWTDIDIVGYADAPNRVYSSPTDLKCG